jgi:hypothetical protein
MNFHLNEIIYLDQETQGKNLSGIKLIALGYVTALVNTGTWKDGKVLIGIQEENVKDVIRDIEDGLGMKIKLPLEDT